MNQTHNNAIIPRAKKLRSAPLFSPGMARVRPTLKSVFFGESHVGEIG